MTTTHRITTATAVLLSLAAAGAQAASARPAEFVPAGHQSSASVYSRPDKALVPVTTPDGGRVPEPSAQQAVVRIQTPRSGFDWGDAGIGAAAGVALAMLGLGGALLITRRPKPTRNTTALPS